MNRRLAIAVGVLAALVATGIWYLRESDSPPAARPTEAAALPTSRTNTSGTNTKQHRLVTKLSGPEERKRISDKIDSNHAARAALRAGPAPRLPPLEERSDAAMDLEDIGMTRTEFRSAVREVVPFLSECYEAAMDTLPNPILEIKAGLTLRGDPDVGTLIDAAQLFDQYDQPLPTKLDACLRGTLQELQLPPLVEGDLVEVTWPFKFRPAP
ncbi:MAG: hypothetical protein JWO36_4767 [Myxococcales bacterium]|nr:hypothetical protein [Myxococcales bacterium]